MFFTRSSSSISQPRECSLKEVKVDVLQNHPATGVVLLLGQPFLTDLTGSAPQACIYRVSVTTLRVYLFSGLARRNVGLSCANE